MAMYQKGLDFYTIAIEYLRKHRAILEKHPIHPLHPLTGFNSLSVPSQAISYFVKHLQLWENTSSKSTTISQD